MTGAYLSLYSQDRPELGRGSGAERMCSCPSPVHEDRNPSCSVQVESGKWFCHGCGEGGGVVKWLRLTRGLPGPEALETARRLGLAPEPRVNGRLPSSPNGRRPYRQPSSVDNAPPTDLPSRYAACYRYRTPDGTEYARVCRYPENRPDRKADPYTRRSDGKYAGTWTHRAPQHRWPYRIEHLSESGPVVIVEGEKCADALAGLTREVGVLSWLGGSGAVLRTDWGALSGREVILWPDADDPGREAMARLAGELDRIGAAEALMISPEEDRPDGWDVADAIAEEGWGWKETQQYLLRAEPVDQQECRRLRRVAEKVLVTAEGIDPDRIEWIWEPYLPAGAVTLMAGAPGCGKSFLSIALAASLSQGLTPFHRRRTGKVPTAILSLEDDPARTIVPRLKACGADLGEMVIFDWRHPEADSLDTLSMREGTEGELLRVLREGVKLHGLRMVIIDTLTAFTPARMDGHEAVAVRQMMKPLARFASDCGVAVLVICHARKRSSHDSTHGVQATVLGSVDYVASCRSAVLVQKDPKSDEGTAGIMTHAKCNFGPLGPSISFSIGEDGWRWGEERQESADEIEEALLARREHKKMKDREEWRESRRARTQARIAERIRTYLEENPGEEFSTRELKETAEVRYDTVAGVLNGMREEGRVVRRRKGKQRVLWSLAGGEIPGRKESGREPPQTASRSVTASQESEKNGKRLVAGNSTACPVENQPLPISPPLYARAGSGLGSGLPAGTEKERKRGSGKPPPKPNGRSP